jgi:hypothetical protein
VPTKYFTFDPKPDRNQTRSRMGADRSQLANNPAPAITFVQG